MDARVSCLNFRLKRYDFDLYCKRSNVGVINVYRKGKRYVECCEFEGEALFNLIDSPQFVFSLTDNWKTNGAPRDWGSEKVLERLREIDAWESPEFLDEIERENEKVEERRARNLKNETESFLIDNKRMFQKAFDGINTSTLSKREKRKEKLDKRRF